MKITTNLETYDDTETNSVDITIDVGQERIVVGLIDDHLENEDGSITPVTYPRSVAVELKPDGVIQVLLYGVDRDEPTIVHLSADGQVKVLEESEQ